MDFAWLIRSFRIWAAHRWHIALLGLLFSTVHCKSICEYHVERRAVWFFSPSVCRLLMRSWNQSAFPMLLLSTSSVTSPRTTMTALPLCPAKIRCATCVRCGWCFLATMSPATGREQQQWRRQRDKVSRGVTICLSVADVRVVCGERSQLKTCHQSRSWARLLSGLL